MALTREWFELLGKAFFPNRRLIPNWRLIPNQRLIPAFRRGPQFFSDFLHPCLPCHFIYNMSVSQGHYHRCRLGDYNLWSQEFLGRKSAIRSSSQLDTVSTQYLVRVSLFLHHCTALALLLCSSCPMHALFAFLRAERTAIQILILEKYQECNIYFLFGLKQMGQWL